MQTRSLHDVDQHCNVDNFDGVNRKEGTRCIHDIDSMLINNAISTMSTMLTVNKRYDVDTMSTRYRSSLRCRRCKQETRHKIWTQCRLDVGQHCDVENVHMI